MKIVIAPDSYKGSIYASDAARAMEVGVRRVLPDAEVVLVPVADGGDSRIVLLEPNGSFLAACRIGEDVRTSLEGDGDLIYFGATDSTIGALRIKGNGNPDEEWVFVTNADDPHPSGRPKKC